MRHTSPIVASAPHPAASDRDVMSMLSRSRVSPGFSGTRRRWRRCRRSGRSGWHRGVDPSRGRSRRGESEVCLGGERTGAVGEQLADDLTDRGIEPAGRHRAQRDGASGPLRARCRCGRRTKAALRERGCSGCVPGVNGSHGGVVEVFHDGGSLRRPAERPRPCATLPSMSLT